MKQLAHKLNSFSVKAQSPDNGLIGTFRGQAGVSIEFASDADFQLYELSQLESQLAALLRLLTVGRMRAYTSILNSHGMTIDHNQKDHWNKKTRLLAERRTKLEAQGISNDEYVRIDTVGLRDFKVAVDDEVHSHLTPEEFCSEVGSAISDLVADFSYCMSLLKEEIYGYRPTTD